MSNIVAVFTAFWLGVFVAVLRKPETETEIVLRPYPIDAFGSPRIKYKVFEDSVQVRCHIGEEGEDPIAVDSFEIPKGVKVRVK